MVESSVCFSISFEENQINMNFQMQENAEILSEYFIITLYLGVMICP